MIERYWKELLSTIIYSNKLAQKMSLNLYLSAAHSTLQNQPSKVSSSQGTDASQPPAFGKHLSLISCASSLSVEEDHYHSLDNQLFARYLFAQTERSKQICFEQLRHRFHELSITSPEKLQSFLSREEGSRDEEGQVLQHYISRWLQFMGYGSSTNKKYFINRVKLMIGDEKAHKLAKMYTNLSCLGLSFKDLLQFLVNTCTNGWQYFIRQLIKMQASCRLKA